MKFAALAVLALVVVGCAETDSEPASESAAADSLADVMPLADGSTHSSVTPMGIHFERFASKVPTADERAFLSDASREPGVPPSRSTSIRTARLRLPT